MSSRPVKVPYKLINNGDMSASITSPVTVKPLLSKITYSMSWTGVPVGTFDVQVSDDYSENSDGTVRNAGTWNSIPFSSTVVAAGGASNGFYEAITGAYATRLVYTRTSGTGSLQAYITGQVM